MEKQTYLPLIIIKYIHENDNMTYSLFSREDCVLFYESIFQKS